MIVAELKPFEEIVDSISSFKKIAVVACGGCVSVCLTGGARTAENLIRELAHPRHYPSSIPPVFEPVTIQRQCEKDFVKAFLTLPPDADAVLSLACGAGVQTVAEAMEALPVLPSLNTTFLASLDAPGLWREKCQGCGNCLLAHTGGVCPVSRCAKRLLNGPCGGSQGGRCEIGPDTDCAWQLIIDRLKALDRLDEYDKLFPLKDWSSDRGKGPRVMGVDKTTV